jgi:seryl-tRNA synthetase
MINYSLISKAIKAYKKLGYKYIDVPWTVSRDIIDITLPVGRVAFSADGHNFLVGSAEQSFLHLIINENLKSGKYVAASPCFRDDEVDKYHQKYFFKVELIHYSSDASLDKSDLSNLIADTYSVLKNFSNKKIQFFKTKEGYDLAIDGVEIGSYGIREFNGFNWVYGTGIAEPRFSQVK